MFPKMIVRNVFCVLVVFSGLLAGCKQPPPAPEKPALSLQELDTRISESKTKLEALKNQPVPSVEGRSIADLEKEVKERKARISFLQAEIDALLRQRAAAEIYYRQKGTSQ